MAVQSASFFTNLGFAELEILAAAFLFALLFFFRKTGWRRDDGNKIKSILKALAFSVAIMLTIHYFKSEWLSPVLQRAGKSRNIVQVILAFIAIMMSLLTAISIFLYNLIHKYYLDKANFIMGKMAQEAIKQASTNIEANDIRIRLNQNLFRDHQKYFMLRDKKAGERTRLISGILPIFSSYADKSRERQEISEAFHVLRQSKASLLEGIDEAWAYIEKEVAPRFKDDPELYPLILETIKRRS